MAAVAVDVAVTVVVLCKKAAIKNREETIAAIVVRSCWPLSILVFLILCED